MLRMKPLSPEQSLALFLSIAQTERVGYEPAAVELAELARTRAKAACAPKAAPCRAHPTDNYIVFAAERAIAAAAHVAFHVGYKPCGKVRMGWEGVWKPLAEWFGVEGADAMRRVLAHWFPWIGAFADDHRGNTGFKRGEVETRHTLSPAHAAVLADANACDLALYATGYYHQLVHVARSRGFRMARVRLRAVAYFAQSATKTGDATCDFHARPCNWTLDDVGEALLIENATDFEVVDCDVWATKHAVNVHFASFGVFARNRVRGQQCPGADQARQQRIEGIARKALAGDILDIARPGLVGGRDGHAWSATGKGNGADFRGLGRFHVGAQPDPALPRDAHSPYYLFIIIRLVVVLRRRRELTQPRHGKIGDGPQHVLRQKHVVDAGRPSLRRHRVRRLGTRRLVISRKQS